jgi:hypothetical protein
MTYRKIDCLKELERLARGKKTTIPAREVAAWAMGQGRTCTDGC